MKKVPHYDPTNDLVFKFVFGRDSLLPCKEPFSQYGLYNPKNQHKLTDDLELDFLEIPKYKNKPVKEMNRVERWLAYFANRLDDEGKEELAMSNPEIAEAMEASDRFMMDDKAYHEYLKRESAIWDYNNDMAGSREEGEEKTWVASVRNLMKSMKLTAQQAVEALAVPMELRQKVLKQI